MRDTSATVLFSESQANPPCLGIRGWSGRLFRLFRTPNHCCVAFLVLFLLGLVQPGLAATDENLVQDPGLQVQGENATLQHWETGRSEVPGVTRSRFQVGEPAEGTGRMLGIWGGRDRAGIWAGNLKGVKPYTDYLLCFTVYRKQAVNGMYPSVRIFGQTCRLNQAWFTRRLHQVELVLNSGPSAGRERLVFANTHPLWIWFGRPAVKELSWKNRNNAPTETVLGESGYEAALNPVPAGKTERFPLGLYGTGIEDYPKIAETPFWLVKAPPTPKAVNKAHSLGLNVFCRMPHGEQKLSKVEAAFGQEGFGQDDFFYIDDEPELRSVDPARLQAVRSRLREIWPRVQGAVANVRPRFVQTYRQAAEIFMMDQYPVPSQPMTWLSQSIDLAHSILREKEPEMGHGRNSQQTQGVCWGGAEECFTGTRRTHAAQEVWAIIQAFGGKKMKQHGWPRMPSYEEMRCLSFLALVHNARGLLFFTYSHLKKDSRAWAGVQRIGRQVRALEHDLLLEARFQRVPVRVRSRFQVDAGGGPAVHTGIKWQDGGCLLLAVNVIDRPVEAEVGGLARNMQVLYDPFSRKRYVVKKGTVLLDLDPYEVVVLQGGSKNRTGAGCKAMGPTIRQQGILTRAPRQEAGPGW